MAGRGHSVGSNSSTSSRERRAGRALPRRWRSRFPDQHSEPTQHLPEFSPSSRAVTIVLMGHLLQKASLPVLAAILAISPTRLEASTSAEVPPESVALRPYGVALREARTRNRNLLLVFNSPFCYFCRALDHLLFTNPAGIRLINAAYVPVAFTLKNDPADTTPVTKEAKRVAKRLGIGHVPQVVVLSPKGGELGRFGWTSSDEVLLNLRRLSAPPDR
jgi:thioredoxin-related protein